ncbi:major facilitator superfamily domain-containing protein [Calycina marina]|uniref:Major facilitator superfamily domain-containing protein n=1 Tax=Calycina marina TaxID=1763456 RepID=A0A9P7YYE9_9HELO|nr:major facilitator superfamily domain-containing protein [Calycina marina]
MRSFFRFGDATDDGMINKSPDKADNDEDLGRPAKWSMGVLNDRQTHDVPGSVILLTDKNESSGPWSSRPSTAAGAESTDTVKPRRMSRQSKAQEGKKLTDDGKIILEPQPDDSNNDPLNWPGWKRDVALLSLGLYCLVGGGGTSILAAGFTDVAKTYDTTTSRVALTTGLYMMGLGIGSVLASPTAILYGKRPVYLGGALMFILTSIWCAASPSYNSLLLARILQGISLSPIECLPSATIAEIFYLHERAFRISIYTLLLLGGKNLVPLVSAVIIQSLKWRWVFWICAIVGGVCWSLLFLFVPETFWEREVRLHSAHHSQRNSAVSGFAMFRRSVSSLPSKQVPTQMDGAPDGHTIEETSPATTSMPPRHIGFASTSLDPNERRTDLPSPYTRGALPDHEGINELPHDTAAGSSKPKPIHLRLHRLQDQVSPSGAGPPTPQLHNLNSPFYGDIEKNDVDKQDTDYFNGHTSIDDNIESQRSAAATPGDNSTIQAPPPAKTLQSRRNYTAHLQRRSTLTFLQTMKPYNGRLHRDNWLKVAMRPFILFTYPAVLWSSMVYACSVGWLIVLSESVAIVYREPTTYNFSALSTGLVYISPFIGGILGTAVAAKVSDFIVQELAKRNGGLYEPEFRLIMAIPSTLATVLGLIGFGWSAQHDDPWIAPTVFFGVISFGCSLGSTTAITFCIDSYKQFAGEALVTLNFSKNLFHGLVFSLFFPSWLEKSGSKSVFIWLGVIQVVLMTSTVPMYMFGKRARMWTVRKKFIDEG